MGRTVFRLPYAVAFKLKFLLKPKRQPENQNGVVTAYRQMVYSNSIGVNELAECRRAADAPSVAEFAKVSGCP